MIQHDFNIINGDTDSIMFCKQDGSPFSQLEQDDLLAEINSLLPEHVKMANDGYFDSVLIIKAKNYALISNGKIKIKGSGLKASQKCPALKEFTKLVIEYLLNDKENHLIELYNEYALEIMDVKDIKRFSSRKTVTASVLNPQRTNERKVLDAIQHLGLQEGDRFHTFFKKDKSLCVAEEFTGDYDVDSLLGGLFNTMKIFATVIDIKKYPNYTLKKNKKLLESLK